MCARFIIIEGVQGQNLPQVRFAEDHHSIQALAAPWQRGSNENTNGLLRQRVLSEGNRLVSLLAELI